jgi:nucleotide-binding universal stress UspA family protein
VSFSKLVQSEELMSVICGTDFSSNARQASEVAAALAGRMGQTLVLVHVVDVLPIGPEKHASYDALGRRLQDEARRLADGFKANVEPVVVPGAAHKKLVELAGEYNASLVVLGALSAETARWALGSVAERVAQVSPAPVFVIRDAERLLNWLTTERALHALVGVDGSATSRAALDFAMSLRGMGRVDLVLTQIASPLGEYNRYGVVPLSSIDRLRPELEALLVRDLEAWTGEVRGEGSVRFSVRPGLGRLDTHLERAAREADVDLVVVGTRQRAGVARIWQSSVSRGMLHAASTNVVCVPHSREQTLHPPVPDFRRVLCATDFSEPSRRAVATAYGLVRPGGVVHLTYVHHPGARETTEAVKTRLSELIPPEARSRGVHTELEVVADDAASLGICRAAKRLAVDAICMATHGREGISRIVLGSVAQEVLGRAEQVVVLVPPQSPSNA